MDKADPENKQPNGKKRRGTPRRQSRGARLLTENEQAYGWPTQLSRENDLSDDEILEGIIADAQGDGWYVNGKRLPAPFRGPAELQPSLMRDIHLFVCRVIKSKKKSSSVPAYYLASNGEYSETFIGAEYSKIESALRAGSPTARGRYSEHVRLFLEGYQAFGLDGGVGDPSVIGEYAGAAQQQQAIVNGLVEWIRRKSVEKIEQPKPHVILPDGFPKFTPVKPSKKKAVRGAAGRPRRRDPESGKFQVSSSLPTVVIGQVVFPAVGSRIKDDTFQTRLRLRRAKPASNNRKAAELVERLFQRVEAVRVIQLDVGIRPEYVGESHKQAAKAVKDSLKIYFNYGVKNIGPFRGMVGRIAKLAFTRDRGYFCRIMFLFEAVANSSFVGLADRLGSYWADTATRGRGVYSVIGPGAARFRLEPKGPIRRFDSDARIALLRAVRYLTVTDEYLRPDLPVREISFLASDLPLWRDPPATRRGNDTIQDYVYKPSESSSATGKQGGSGKSAKDTESPGAPSTLHAATNAKADQGDPAGHESGASATEDARASGPAEDLSGVKARRASKAMKDVSPPVVEEVSDDDVNRGGGAKRGPASGKMPKRRARHKPMIFDNEPQQPADDSPD